MALKCSYDGCPNVRIKDRIFCAEHIDDYPVMDVPTFRRRGPGTDSEPKPRPNSDDEAKGKD
jgi:hypothetical protein